MLTTPHPRRAALLLAIAGTLAGACSDGPRDNPLITPENTDPSAMLYYADPDINQGDTYYLAEVYQEGSTTVDSDRPITDPETGAVSYQRIAYHQPETQRVEGGYDYYGRIVQVLDQTDPMADPLTTPVNLTRRSRSVEEEITRYDQHRQPLDNEIQPMEAMGGGPSHEQITDGLIIDAEAIDTLAALTPTVEPLAVAAGPRARVVRSRPDEFQITNEVAPEEMGMGAPAKGVAQPEVRGEAVRTYRRRGQKYILEQVDVTTVHRAEGTQVRQRQSSRVRMLRFHENPQKDRERREKRRGKPVPTEMAPLSATEICPMYVDDGSSTCQEPPPDEPPPPPYVDPCPQVSSGYNVIFQHGILSDGNTWWRMDPWIRCSFQTNLHIRPSINWFNSIPTQREELRGFLPTYGNETILVGHSNGGLVSRSLAQWAQMYQPGRVRGVVTLDSPNQGAIVAINIQVLETALFSLAGNAGFVFDILHWHPFYEDDVPYSPFLLRTNGFDENFKRVGIQTHTPKRWVLWRIAWTPKECTPESYCGERAVARRIQEAYDRHRHYARFWYRPWQSIPAQAAMLGMNSVDAVWHSFTAPHGLTSDGFIHGQGQVYPRANRNQLIRNGDSHVGVTRSDLVKRELEAALADPNIFNVPIRQ